MSTKYEIPKGKRTGGNDMKKTRKILVSIMLCLCAFILLKGNVGTANAKTFTTKAQVKSEIKKVNQKISKLNKEIAKDKKQYKIYNARSKKKTKGCFPILLGRIISRNPFVVYNWDKYFHVKNPAKGAEYLGTYSAEVKYTGKSVNYDGMNVDTVMVISDPDRRKAKAIKNRYEKNRESCSLIWQREIN